MRFPSLTILFVCLWLLAGTLFADKPAESRKAKVNHDRADTSPTEALKLTARANCVYEKYVAQRAVDGNRGTMWNGRGKSPQWIEFDLGEQCRLDRAVLWGEGSPNAKTYHEVWFSNQPIGNDLKGANKLAKLRHSPEQRWNYDLEFVSSGIHPPAGRPGEFKAQPTGRYLQIRTINSWWAEWYEIEVEGTPVVQVSSQARQPILHNTFDSKKAIYKSRIGPGGVYRGEGGRFVEGVSGKALQLKHDEYEAVAFPKEVVPHQAGCIEFWAKLTDLPQVLHAGQRPALLQIIDGKNVYGIHFNGNDGFANGGLCGWAGIGGHCGSGQFGTWRYESIFGADRMDAWHHYALVWDQNGLDGAAKGKKFAVYLNGRLNTAAWRDNGQPDFKPLTGGELKLHIKHDALGQGTIRYDELKIWDYAKTNFGDRFEGRSLALQSRAPSSASQGSALESQATDNDSLILHYNLDQHRKGGAVWDESDHGNNATAHVKSKLIDGAISKAFQFDGKSEYISRDYDPKSGLHPTKTPFTVSAWFRTSEIVPREQTIVCTHYAGSGHDGYKLTVHSEQIFAAQGIRGQLAFMVGAGKHHVLIADKQCSDGRWHHAAGVWDGKQARLYLDGELQKSQNTTGTIPYTHRSPFMIGHSKSDGSQHAKAEKYYFEGAIDDVRFYNRALSGDEVKSLAKATVVKQKQVSQPAAKDLKYKSRTEAAEALRKNPSEAIDVLKLYREYRAAKVDCLDVAMLILVQNPEVAKEAASHLRGILAGDDNEARRLAAIVLADIGQHNEQVIAALVEGLKHPTRFDRLGGRGAYDRLAAIGKPAVPALIKARAFSILGEIGRDAQAAIPVVTEGLRDKDVRQRLAAALALYQIADDSKQALPVLTAGLTDKEWQVRLQAVRAVGELGSNAKPAEAAVKKLLDDEKEIVRRTASEIIDELKQGSALESQATDKSLVLHYTFDRARKNDVEPDESDHGNNAKIHGAAWRKAGRIGGAMEFDGNDWIDCGNDKSLNFGAQDFTVALWFKTSLRASSRKHGYNTFLNKGAAGSLTPARPGYGMYATSEHNKTILRWDFGQRSHTGRARVITDQWQPDRWNHTALVRRGKTIEAYLNGERVTKQVQKATSDLSVSGPEHLLLGKFIGNNGTAYFYQGLLDDVRIYNRALASEEIAALYKTAPPRFVHYDPRHETQPTEQGFRLLDDARGHANPRVSGGVLKQGPTTTKGMQRWYTTAIPIDFSADGRGTAVEWMAQVKRSGLFIDRSRQWEWTGWGVQLKDKNGRTFDIYLDEDRVLLNRDDGNRPIATHKFDTTDRFHHYRFVIDDGQGMLFIDGSSKPALAGKIGAPNQSRFSQPNEVAFGDGTSNALSEVHVKNFWYANDAQAKSPFHPRSLALQSQASSKMKQGSALESQATGGVLQMQTATYRKSSQDFAREKNDRVEVGVGNSHWGFGAVGYELQNVRRVQAAIENLKFSKDRWHDWSFVGFTVHYHTAKGYTKHIALAIDGGVKHYNFEPTLWATRSSPSPDPIVRLERQKKYDFDLFQYAPPNWDGRAWFNVVLQNGPAGSLLHTRLTFDNPTLLKESP